MAGQSLSSQPSEGVRVKALRWLTRVGPAFVIAAVVLGPGSVTTMTKMGATQGYRMLWLPVAAGALMAGFTLLFMRFGIAANRSVLQHCAATWGRPFAALAGLSMFYVCAAFQFGNNLGVMTSINSLLQRPGQTEPPVAAWVWPVAFNALALVFLFGFRRLYTLLERSMTLLVALMLVAFFLNLFFARPSVGGIARGLVPSLPGETDWALVAGIVATTFSIVAAIFQAYLVRARGWTQADYGKGVADSFSGIGMLALISTVVMVTSAAVLHPRQITVRTAGDMAVQLESLLGFAAKAVFCIGLFSAAFSSFVVNAMIGGTLLSDGFGLGEDMSSVPARVGTTLCLLIGMVVAMLIAQWKVVDYAQALVAAQAGTLLGIPLAILATLVTLLRPQAAGARPLGALGKAFVVLGMAVLVAVTAVSSKSTVVGLRQMLRASSHAGR